MTERTYHEPDPAQALFDGSPRRTGAILEFVTPAARPGGRLRSVDMREVINTLLQSRTGCQWSMLPNDLLPRSTVYEYLAAWRDDGTCQDIVDALRGKSG